ncbi:MAG: asparagine synthase (glutamine-hydrolyzing), partial [Planctomycetota bacterium]
MCGIAGLIGIDEPGLIERMTASIVHRGPDDSGFFTARDSELGTVTFGHRRLSIIDLSGGHQPMTTPSGNHTIVFNGEIYNFAEIRDRLIGRGIAFETNCDTEVLLRLYETDGPEGLHQLNGMFAFAIYDRTKNEVFIARDRIGIKPLYYVEIGKKLLFASEAKALLRHDGWDREINPHAIHDYLGLRYVPGHTSMFRQVRRLGPGESLTFKAGKATVQKWWHPPQHEGSYPKSEGEYLDELSEIMERSVRRRLIADVPFGAYLSGGLDSSLIVALMSKICTTPIQTFSVGFDYEHDELSEAAATAELLGASHHELACRAEDVALLPEVVYHSDEPMGDAINIPMYQLAKEATKQVTVILTGEGADEMFGGYLFHKVMWAAQVYRTMVPGPLRRWVVQPLMSMVPAGMMNLAFKYPAYLGQRGKQ